MVRTMGGDQFVARKRGPPITLAARDKEDLALFVGKPIECLLTARSVRRSRLRARGSASTSAHHSSPVGSCGCAHDRRSTASRACSIAATKLATSGWLISSKAKFGVTVTTVLRNPSVPTQYLRAHKSPSRVRFWANWTLSRHRRMTECDRSGHRVGTRQAVYNVPIQSWGP